MVVEDARTRAIDMSRFGDHPLLQPGGRHEEFESGAGRIAVLYGAVLERTVRVVDKLIPILLGDPGRKTVGIEGRRAGHGKDFSVGRVHGTMVPTLPARSFSAAS